ncbi:hypothetical protein [Actinacidiphila sp. bgisy160]|uniref:hypothetical protein n=1 Tax=Actinacidiphila sp. bgisy160 TaxID=3413796 RepID=UPI003D730E9E
MDEVKGARRLVRPVTAQGDGDRRARGALVPAGGGGHDREGGPADRAVHAGTASSAATAAAIGTDFIR